MENQKAFEGSRKNNTNILNSVNNNQNNKKEIDYGKKPKDGALKLGYNNIEVYDRNDQPNISKKTNDQVQKFYQSINSIFFYDNQQKYIKDQKINEFKKEELQKKYLMIR